MMLTAELELSALILVLYVQDAALLLHNNEGVLSHCGQGRWQLGLGSANTRIGGKNLYLPNLLAVQRPHYRMRWNFEADADSAAAAKSAPGWAPQTAAFAVLGWLCLLLGLLQGLVLPAVMFRYQTDLSVIAVLVALYATVIAALAVVWRQASVFKLSGRKFAALCFECLVCPPLAINLVRRLSLDLCPSADLLAVARQCLDSEAWQAACQILAQRLEDQISLEPQDSPRYAALQSRRIGLAPTRSGTDEQH
jgi:hypothetical protein